MTRRSAVAITTGLALTATGRTPAAPAPATAGRLKQSAARWCYSRIPLDELCRQAAELGLSGIDLVDSQDWPTLRKYGLVPAVTQGKGRIPDGWNRKESPATAPADCLTFATRTTGGACQVCCLLKEAKAKSSNRFDRALKSR